MGRPPSPASRPVSRARLSRSWHLFQSVAMKQMERSPAFSGVGPSFSDQLTVMLSIWTRVRTRVGLSGRMREVRWDTRRTGLVLTPVLAWFASVDFPSFGFLLGSRWRRWFSGGGAALSGGGGGGAGVLAPAGLWWCLFLPVVEVGLGWSRRRGPADGPFRRPCSLRPSLLVRAAAAKQR
jgi:hypothetical protein